MTVEGHIEIELKYRVGSAAGGERLLHGDELGSFTAEGAAHASESEDRYIDTRDGALARAGYAARLRRERTTTVVTVKSLGGADGALQRRTEIEGPAERTLAPADWPHSPARAFILELCGDVPLVELVTIRQMRRKRQFRDGTTLVELSLDEVEVIARTQHVDRFTELELELIDGPEEPLVALGGVLDNDPVLTPSRVSKLDAALAALAGAGSRKSGRMASAANGAPGDPRGVRETRNARQGRPGSGSDAPADRGRSGAVDRPRGDEAANPRRGDATGADAGRAVAPTAERGSESTSDARPTAEGQALARAQAPGRTAPPAEGSTPTPAGASAPGEPTAAPTAGGDGSPAAAPPASGAPGTAIKPEAAAPAPDIAGLVVGKTPGVTSDDIVAEAGRKVLRFQLARLIAREAGTRAGKDPEELHAMRVATRRMRAAWRVFGDGFRPDGTRRFRRRLRDVARRLGAVRDIDVLLIALEEYRADLPAPERAALQPLVDDWRGQRDAARDVLMRELDSDGYRRFVDDYRAFVLTPGAGALSVSPTIPHHVRDTAGSRIWQAYEQVLGFGPVLRWADVPTLHQMRIAGKWLRYTLEFVAEAIGPEAKPLIERVVAMQDHLGLMNDAEVAAMKARALLVARAGRLTDAQTTAIARYLTSREREVARLKRGAAAPWRALASPTFRRGLGRAIAGLAATPTATTGG